LRERQERQRGWEHNEGVRYVGDGDEGERGMEEMAMKNEEERGKERGMEEMVMKEREGSCR